MYRTLIYLPPEIIMAEQKNASRGAVFLNAIGTIIIILAIAVCLLLALPRVFGIYGYTILSGSMEPAIPVGSIVYAKTTADPATLNPGDIIVFYEGLGDVPVVHRLVENHTSEREIITKGDANAAEDLRPIPYQNIIGKDVLHIPKLGALLSPLGTISGKLYILAMAAGGLLLCFAARHKT